MFSKTKVIPNKVENIGVDVLRAVAISMVVAYHAFIPIYGAFLPWSGWFRNLELSPSQQLLWFYPITFGWVGVPLFFVLSGFCIHLSFLRNEKNFDIILFLWRRFWRIYPAYFISLLFFTKLSKLNIFSHSGSIQFFTHALFLQNINESTFFGINPSFWSISVEVQLYLLFPLLLFLRTHFGIVRCLQISLAIGLLFRAIAVTLWGIPDHLITPALTSPLITWFDWILGAFVAERFVYGRPAFNNKKIWLYWLIPLFIVTTIFKPLTIFSFSFAAAISAVILDAVIYFCWRKSLGVAFLTVIGTISYSIYLWHQPLLFSITEKVSRLSGSLILGWLLLIPFIILGSWISYHCFEQSGIKVGTLMWKHVCKKINGRATK